MYMYVYVCMYGRVNIYYTLYTYNIGAMWAKSASKIYSLTLPVDTTQFTHTPQTRSDHARLFDIEAKLFKRFGMVCLRINCTIAQ